MDDEATPITPLQIRLAKAALGLSNPALSEKTGLNRNTLNAAENGSSSPNRSTLTLLRKFFESEGIVFIPENGGGAGVRLRHPLGKAADGDV